MKIRKGKSKLKERAINMEVFQNYHEFLLLGPAHYTLPRSTEADEGR